MITRPLTNTCVGWPKLVVSRAIGVVLIFASLLAACGRGKGEFAETTVEVSQPGSAEIDFDLIVENVQDEVQQLLPDAYLRYVSLTAQCADLALLRGEVTLEFVQTRRTIFGEQIMIARAKVDTERKQLTIQTRDETEFYPATELLILDGLAIRDVAENLQDYLLAQEGCDGMVALARTNTGGAWGVRCGPPDQVFIECLEIDPTTGEITKLR